MLVQFKTAAKYDGTSYRQNQRVSVTEARAARLVALHLAELVDPMAATRSFTVMVDTIREVRAKARPPVSKAAREKAEAERREFTRRTGLELATQF